VCPIVQHPLPDQTSVRLKANPLDDHSGQWGIVTGKAVKLGGHWAYDVQFDDETGGLYWDDDIFMASVPQSAAEPLSEPSHPETLPSVPEPDPTCPAWAGESSMDYSIEEFLILFVREMVPAQV
jgi:hypothetical protein